MTFVKKFEASSSGECQRRASQAYLYYQDEDKMWIKENSDVTTSCQVEEIDYSVPRNPIPDPVEPPQPPQPPIWIMGGGPMIEPRPIMMELRLEEDQEMAMAVWDKDPAVVVLKDIKDGENEIGEKGASGFDCGV